MNRRPLLFAPAAALLSPRLTRAAPSRAIRVSGSSFALAVLRQLAESFSAKGGAPVEVLPSVGSSGAFRALSEGVIDVAISSRPATPAEATAGISVVHFASTPLAFVTRASEPSRALALREVARIFAGDFGAWPEGTPVRFVRRQPSDSDWDLLATAAPALARAVAIARERHGVPTFTNDQDYADALERLPGAFGCLTLGQVAAERRRLRPIAVDDVVPSVASLEAAAWPFIKQLFIAHGPSPRPEVLAFTAYFRSSEVVQVLTDLNHLPIGKQTGSRL